MRVIMVNSLLSSADQMASSPELARAMHRIRPGPEHAAPGAMQRRSAARATRAQIFNLDLGSKLVAVIGLAAS